MASNFSRSIAPRFLRSRSSASGGGSEPCRRWGGIMDRSDRECSKPPANVREASVGTREHEMRPARAQSNLSRAGSRTARGAT